MPREVAPWIGRTDDSMPSRDVRLRISARQGDCCALCRTPLGPKNRGHCDHIIPLADEGENVESNLQMICATCHERKTSGEATVRAKVRRTKASNILALAPSEWRSRPLGNGNNQHRATTSITPKFEGDVLAPTLRKESPK
jgi:hypothetical protein